MLLPLFQRDVPVAGSLARILAALLLCALPVSPAWADDAAIAKLLRDKGATVTEAKGVVTGVSLRDGTKLTDAEFGQLGQLKSLKTLDVSGGLNDARLAQLTGLGALESLQTNLAQVTDAGVQPLAQLKNLRTLKFFHPGPAFSGAGLAQLAALPYLERLTVAGSLAFNDEGMKAVAKLTHLQEFRCWHAGPTQEGIKQLRNLPNLKSLNLGQRLTYKAPACPTDETLAILADLKTLETLQLSEARLHLPALQQLKRLPALKKLTLDGIQLPKAHVEQLRQDLPLVKVEWTEPSEAYQKRIQALFGAE